MAHHANTQIQQHSVGDIFPFVVYRQDRGGYPAWGIEGAGFSAYPYTSYDAAHDAAKELKDSDLTIEQALRNEAALWASKEEDYLFDARNGL